ncbi:hypothetical protein IQ233_16855 [Nodularia sp. LEGE 06071]|nr:hypothetical protein [Nodularia sp. LEGE 06071]MCC2692081.1 hypothetical protein [Nodularia sp. LEGE 04288]
MQPQKPIQAAIEDLQKSHSHPSSKRQKFFAYLKQKHPNFHIFYVFFNIIAIWNGFFNIFGSWADGVNLLEAPAPEFSLPSVLRYLSLLAIGLIMLLLDDLSLKELLFGRKTTSEKPFKVMNYREKLFHIFKNRYPNLSTIYTLIGIVFCWCGMIGLLNKIPMPPFLLALISVFGGFFFLYIDDMKLDEL